MPASFDFEKDIKDQLSNDFLEYGITIPTTKDLHGFLLDYYTIIKKFIPVKPRIIRISPPLIKQLKNHPKKQEILHIVEQISKGANVNYFQSKRLIQSNFHDHLLYEWNIYHLHLSIKKEKKNKFVKQTNSMLFVYFDANQAILLGTAVHKDGIFGDVSWQEMLHDYFPEVIEPYKTEDIQLVEPNLNGADRQTLWNKGFTLGFTNVRDQVYVNPGIGRTTSGHSLKVTMLVNDLQRWLYEITKQIRQHYVQLCEFLKVSPENASLRLIIDDSNTRIIETSTNTCVVKYRDLLDLDIICI